MKKGKTHYVIKASYLLILTTIILYYMSGTTVYMARIELRVADQIRVMVHRYTKSGINYTPGGELAIASGAHAIARERC